jgi:hypothetical protein
VSTLEITQKYCATTSDSKEFKDGWKYVPLVARHAAYGCQFLLNQAEAAEKLEKWSLKQTADNQEF